MIDNLQTLKELSVKVNDLAKNYRYREALQLSDMLLEKGGPNKEHLFFRSIWLHKVGKNKDAAVAIEQAIQLGLNDINARILLAKLLLITKRPEECLAISEKYFNHAPAIFGKYKADALKQKSPKAAIEWLFEILKNPKCQTVINVDTFLKLAAIPPNGLEYIKPIAKNLSSKIEMLNALGNEYLWYQDAQRKSLIKVLEGTNPLKATSKLINALYLLKDDEFDEVWRWHQLAANAIAKQEQKISMQRNSRKLRIGFVSSDFRNHSVAYFLKALFKHVDKDKYEIYSYMTNESVDDTTYFFEELSDKFYFAGTMPDKHLLKTIRSDGIDVLVDLNGYTTNHRLGVFSARAAPVQISWLGYPATTAIRNIDYRIVDWDTDPIETKEIYTEELIRLDRLFISFEPVLDVPITRQNTNEPITFGCFNALIL